MAISGPKVQVPTSLNPLMDEAGNIKIEWANFFNVVQAIAQGDSRNGPTASRPTSTMIRWVGMRFFDTTLGKPVFLKYTSSNVWVDGSGSVV